MEKQNKRDGEVIVAEFKKRYPHIPEEVARDMVIFVFNETLMAKLRWDLKQIIEEESDKMEKEKEGKG